MVSPLVGGRPHGMRQCSAFTLVELLVVISIIVALMGMVVAGVGIARKQGKLTKGRAQLAQISAALESYKTINGMYAEGWGLALRDQFKSGSNYREATDAVISWDAVADQLLLQLEYSGEDVNGLGRLRDPWEVAIRYRPARYYPYKAGATLAIDGEDPPGRDAYQLWSTGPDELDQFGAEDDLAGWK